MKTRKYQEEILEYIEGAIAFGLTKMIIEAPTGSGKSLMMSEVCKRNPDKKIVISVSVSKLISQISHHLTLVGVDHSILKAGMDTSFDATKRVQLVMEQTFHARKTPLSADMLIRDEGHIGITGDRFKSLIDMTNPSVQILFSATPYDQYGVALRGYETASFADIKSLTKDGYLMEAKTVVPKFGQQIDLSGIGKSGDYSESELDNLINRPEYNENVVNAYKWKQGGKAIVFVSGIEHAKDLADSFEALDVNAAAMHSKNTTKENDLLMSRFRGHCIDGDDELDVLVTVSMLSIGFDMPECNVVINCRPTKIRSLYVQMIGRVLRMDGDPSSVATIIDCCKATSTHGMYDASFGIKSSRIDAKDEARSIRQPIIDYIATKHEYSLIDEVLLSSSLVEVYNSDSVEANVWRFDNSTTAKVMLAEACDLYERFHGIVTKSHTQSWILERLEPDVKRYGIGAFKTRLKNIITKPKADGTLAKIAGIRFFGEWLQKQMYGA